MNSVYLMMLAGIAMITLALTWIFGSGGGGDKTRAFLGDESNWKDVQIELFDVQGLFGGSNIYISGSGRAVVQTAEPQPGKGLMEKRYEMSLEERRVRDLINEFIKNDFLTISIQDRPGVPDEVRQRIVLINHRGESHTIQKWANDRNKGFDEIFHKIKLVQEDLEKKGSSKPVLERKWDWSDFIPEGFHEGMVVT